VGGGRIPQAAWEDNSAPVQMDARAGVAARSYLETSDNVIVESMRREGGPCGVAVGRGLLVLRARRV